MTSRLLCFNNIKYENCLTLAVRQWTANVFISVLLDLFKNVPGVEANEIIVLMI